MYHRFNESKYPSTNVQMDVFKDHINIIKSSGYDLSLSTKKDIGLDKLLTSLSTKIKNFIYHLFNDLEK